MTPEPCTARIRPFPHDQELRCGLVGFHPQHESVLRDYAHPGSRTTVSWMEDDRRTFHGEWPGACISRPGCPLPSGHRGRCAS